MHTITVRRAVPADLDVLAALFDGYRRFYGRAGDPDAARQFLEERFDRDESVLFIAHEGDRPAGFTQLYPSFSSVSLARVYILNDLFVDERARRKGIASRLVGAATQFAQAQGAARLTLSTAVTNDGAQALYRALGWTRDDRFQVYHCTIPA